MFNHLTIEGRLTKDPERRVIQGVGEVTTFGFYHETKKDAGAQYYQAEAWNRGNYKLADYAKEQLAKGHMGLFIGRIQMRDYETKENDKGEKEKRRVYEIVIDEFRDYDYKRQEEPAEAPASEPVAV